MGNIIAFLIGFTGSQVYRNKIAIGEHDGWYYLGVLIMILIYLIIKEINEKQ